MYPSKIIGQKVMLSHLKPTLKNATILSNIVCENARHLSPFFEQMVQAYATPEKALASLEYDETWRLRCQMLPYYISKNSTIMGEITAEWSDRNRETEVLYWIDKKYSGQGYVSEALKLMERTLFCGGHRQISLYIDATNWRSAEVAKRNGYEMIDNTDRFFKTRKMYAEQLLKEQQIKKHICQHSTNVIECFGSFFGHFR